MASNDQKRMADALSKLEGSCTDYTRSIPNAARTFIRRHVQLSTSLCLANAFGAVAANAAPTQFRAPANGRLLQVHFSATVATTEHGANNAQISVVKATGTGAGTTIATANTTTVANGGTGSLSPGGWVALTVSDLANARFNQGQSLLPLVAQNASGVRLDPGTLMLVVELEGNIDEAS